MKRKTDRAAPEQRNGGGRPQPRDSGGDEHDPKGTPTPERHDTETAGGLHEHDRPHTTGHSAGGERDQD